MTCVSPATKAAWPPVAITRADPPSSATIRATMPSTWATNPHTSPDWIEVTVLRPITESGATASTRRSIAVCETSASSEISTPGAMAPPR